MKCYHCNKDFTSARKDTRFCSNKCRTAYFRNTKKVEISKLSVTSVTDNSVTDNSPVTDQPQAVTPSQTVTLKEDVTFIPNWKRLGLKSKDEAIACALAALQQNRKSILKHSIDKEAVFFVKGRMFKLVEKGYLKE